MVSVSSGDTIHCDGSFLHRFKQSCLCFWGCPVDFIRQHNLRHDRTRSKLKFARNLIKDRHSGDITGKHIRCKLDPAELAAERACQAARQHGFANSRYIFDQQDDPGTADAITESSTASLLPTMTFSIFPAIRSANS